MNQRSEVFATINNKFEKVQQNWDLMLNFAKLPEQVLISFLNAIFLINNEKLINLDKIEQMEDMLIVWMQDMIHKHVPLSGQAVRQKALAIYDFLRKQSSSSTNETFVASRGWFDRFKSRFSLHNVSFSGEKASADQEAAVTFCSQLKKLIEEKNYSYEQIFNCDETG